MRKVSQHSISSESHVSGRTMWLSAAAALVSAVPGTAAFAQGCVVARGAGMTQVHTAPSEATAQSVGKLQSSVAYRYLDSDRHFVGSEEQKHRRREGSQVINKSHFIDFSLSYAFNERFSATLTVPYADHDRSSTVRNAQRQVIGRYHTQNSGLADLRLMGNLWLMDPKANADGNVLLGLGVDIPTGKDDAQDIFQSYDAATGQIIGTKRNVDQSIQLGDGGWGILVDVFAYRRLLPSLSVYANGYYAVTPEETNGVLTNRSNPYEREMGITDSYMARLGVDYLVWPRFNMTLSLGGRVEGVPVHDFVGGSDGFRRPGYAVSVEPGITASFGNLTASLYAPVAVYRNRERSVADMRLSADTGNYRHGDAAFADNLIMFNLTRSF